LTLIEQRGQHGACQQQHQIPTGTHGRPAAKGDQRPILIGAVAHPQLWRETVGVGQALIRPRVPRKLACGKGAR
jgi:hypothetical protein